MESSGGETLELLRPYGPKTILLNHRMGRVGEIEPIFQLKGM